MRRMMGKTGGYDGRREGCSTLPQMRAIYLNFCNKSKRILVSYPYVLSFFAQPPLTEIHQRNCQAETKKKSTDRLSFQRQRYPKSTTPFSICTLINWHIAAGSKILPPPSYQPAPCLHLHSAGFRLAHLGHCRLNVRASCYHLAIKTAFRSLLIHGNQNGAKIEKVPKQKEAAVCEMGWNQQQKKKNFKICISMRIQKCCTERNYKRYSKN